MNVHVALSLIVLIGLVNLHKDKLKTHTLYSKRFLGRKSNEQNRFFQFYPWTNMKGLSKEAFHWEKKRKSCVDLKLTPILEAWISALLTLYLHFIWSGPFSRLILFIYLLLHDFINLHCEEENLFWNKPRNNCIWIFFYYFDYILKLTNYVFPFWWWFKLGFNLLTQHSLISVRVIALWSQDH